MGREFELKYQGNDAVLEAIAAAFSGLRRIEMETSYYDTSGGVLSARKMTLRLRRENHVTVCTLKTPLPDGSRGEWECIADSMDEGLEKLLQLGAPEEIKELAATGLQVCCSARFVRLATEVPTADGTAELALDRGVLLGGGKQTALCEVEVELKTGSDAACAAFAANLAEAYGLVPQPDSKFRRAMALAQEG